MEPTTIIALGVSGFAAWKIARGFLGKVSPDKARALVAGGAHLVDVRSPSEHAAGHLDGSLNIPVQELGGRMAELGKDKAKPVVVYCASGMRSASAAAMLRRAGFADVHDLGSIVRWKS